MIVSHRGWCGVNLRHFTKAYTWPDLRTVQKCPRYPNPRQNITRKGLDITRKGLDSTGLDITRTWLVKTIANMIGQWHLHEQKM